MRSTWRRRYGNDDEPATRHRFENEDLELGGLSDEAVDDVRQAFWYPGHGDRLLDELPGSRFGDPVDDRSAIGRHGGNVDCDVTVLPGGRQVRLRLKHRLLV